VNRYTTTVVIASIFLLGGCATMVDSSGKEPACAKPCATTYSSCMSGAMSYIFPITAQQNCTNALNACVQACPNKNESARTATNQTTEEKLKELKRLHDTGLISDDVYLERQRAILGRP
jgi:hypothetical protein